MSNPWREVFDEVRFSNGNTYDYHQQLSEEDSAIDSAKVQRAVFVIKRLAKEQGIRLPVAMTSYFSSHNDIPPAERAAIRAKLMTEDVEYIEEDPQAIGRGYTAADRSMAQSLGRAQQEQQRRDAARNAQKQTQQKLTTGGSSAQYQSNSYQPEGDELQEKITASTSVKTIIDDFIKSKDRRLAGRTKKERIKAALAASYQAKRKANEEVENFFEEKYGEKYEKKYGPSTGKNTVGNLDGDDQPNEPDSHEYAGVKDRAIKNAIKKRMKSESSDWRADLGFFTEKRYLESPRVETMPPEKESDSEQGSKERAANKRLKPKSAEVKENFQNIAESLGGQLVEWQELNEYTISPSLVKSLETGAEDVAKLFSKRNAFTSTAFRDASRARGVIPKPKSIPTSFPDETSAIEKATNVIFPTGRKLGAGRKPTTITPPNVVSSKQKVEIPKGQFVAPEIPQPVRTPKPKPTPESPPKPKTPYVEPQKQPEVPTKPKTKPAKSLPAVIDLDTGIIQKTIPQGSTVKSPQSTGKPKQPKPQTQTKPQRVSSVPPTGIGVGVMTPTTDKEKKDWELPKLKLPNPAYGQGRTWVARSL